MCKLLVLLSKSGDRMLDTLELASPTPLVRLFQFRALALFPAIRLFMSTGDHFRVGMVAQLINVRLT